MNPPLHPAAVLYKSVKAFPALAACEHYAGSEKTIRKALQLQSELLADERPIFDVTADCEDGAAAGHEAEHAGMVAELLMDASNRHHRLGARIHDVGHPHWREDLQIIVGHAGQRVAYIVLPKVASADDALTQIVALDEVRTLYNIEREIPVHVLIETPGALHEVWQIAALPRVESIDFGLMDFVSAHHGAIPGSAMRSPGQFSHPLIARAKCDIAAAALGNGVIPAHNVTTELNDPDVVREDARRARNEFGFLRMWSIHPRQIQPIVEAMRPDFAEVTEAAGILLAAQNAGWGPIAWEGKLHDRASYRYYWELLRRAHATGAALPPEARQSFFNTAAQDPSIVSH
ncbi:HpcH/HpaI aldolase/citrate lyase family protein [Sulfuritalea hydrogenivorans]|uniref:HpcH/HpaI aldolase n=1 Tax=Sulfuritalea hydrogenivorans sk43H TaxID=1223802 RepID=W0SED0_9PROT|nr:aldolase/citrate lyase family protein [Sulfuritalea hydrogenivorans]MDK9714617.1 aldolase/citrate lyase family protein [Sulfuritalea sp.]BAO29589.1 HpcH/HpaI aldolase [Sulfuritalea hydrogenivorans sk43H]